LPPQITQRHRNPCFEDTIKDLFTLGRQFEPIPMPDADVSMLHEVEMPLPYDTILRKLMVQTIWRQESVKIYSCAQGYGIWHWNRSPN
jgi:hypothetical protein